MVTTKTLDPPTTIPFPTTLSISTSSSSSSSITASSSSSSTPIPTSTPVPASHEHAHSPPLLLILCLTLLLPFAIAGGMLLYRRTCPDHYAKTAQHCPIRRPMYWVRDSPALVAWRARRERNRGILTRQRDYMDRRRTRSSGGTVRETKAERKKRMDEEARDEALRQDMIRQYGRGENIEMTPRNNGDSGVPLVSGAAEMDGGSSPPSYHASGPSSPPPEKMSSPRTPKSPYNANPGVLSSEYLQEFRCKSPPRQAQPQSPAERATSPIAEQVRLARERLVTSSEFARSRTTLGGRNGPGGADDDQWTDVPLNPSSESGQSSRTDVRQAPWDNEAPPIPPRSPDRFGPPLNIVKRRQ